MIIKDITISSEFSKGIYNYIIKKYQLGESGVYYTTRKLYTPYDTSALNNECHRILSPAVRKLRLENFVDTIVLKAFTIDTKYNEVVKDWNEHRNGIVILPAALVRALLLTLDRTKLSDIDFFVDNIILTVVLSKEGTYGVVADFVSFTLV